MNIPRILNAGTSQQSPGTSEQLKGEKERDEVFEIDITGLEFPATKKEIIECAKKANNTKYIMNALERIPDREYHDEGKDFHKYLGRALKEIYTGEKIKSQR